MKKIYKLMCSPALSPFFTLLYNIFIVGQYRLLSVKWKLQGHGKPSPGEARAVSENVTFIYKSFERQSMAKRLYRNIQHYYPGARVIIADDSRKPLRLKGYSLTVLQFPFNMGLSYGIGRALEQSQTPFTMRMDDDTLLTPFTNIHGQLEFLRQHPEVDLVGVQACSAPLLRPAREGAKAYNKFSMKNAPKPLLIPHRTKLDDRHYVMGKVPNIFLARTDKYKSVGYDDNIRMIDHHEFFWRAAGNIVASMDIDAYVFHYHNRFDSHYTKYRSDWKRDIAYIRMKQEGTSLIENGK